MASADYSEMIEMPVSTCEMVVSPEKKRLKKDSIVKKLNKKIFGKERKKEKIEDNKTGEIEKTDVSEAVESNVVLYEREKKADKKFDIVAAQVVAIFALVIAILLTNIFVENSGINMLVKSVFNPEKQTVDTRAYTAFKPTAPCSSEMLTAENGVMTITGECAVYPLAEGNVESVYESNGKYAVTVFHSNNFKSVITGLDMSYVSLGDKIYAGIPVGYVRENAKVTMYEGDRLITNYSLSGGSIVWES